MEKMTIDAYINGEEVEVCVTYNLKDNNGIEIIHTEDAENGNRLVFLGSELETIKEKIWDNLYAADNADDASYPY